MRYLINDACRRGIQTIYDTIKEMEAVAIGQRDMLNLIREPRMGVNVKTDLAKVR